MNNKKFIKKVDELFEALDNPVEIKWIKKSLEWIGLFSVNNNVYQINIEDKLGDDIWRFKFYHYNNHVLSPEKTGLNSDVWRVLPTIKVAFEEFLKEKPIGIIFGASGDSIGRKKIYHSFMKEMSKKFNLTEYYKVSEGKALYCLYQSKVDKDVLYKNIRNIIDEEFN